MNIQLKRITRAQWIVGISLASVLVVWLWCALYWWGQYKGWHSQSHDLIPRIARLSGLIESEADLQAASEQAQLQLQQMVYGDGGDASALMQQQVRRVMEQAGLTVSGSQILNPKKEALFSRLQLEVNASGSVEALELALQDLRELRPLVMIDSLQAQPVRTRVRRGATVAPEQVLSLRIRLSSLRLQP